MISNAFSDHNLWKLIPIINRARDCWIYTADGERILDCWLQNGHALLGHRPRSLANSVKQQIEKGLWGSFPAKYFRQLRQVLALAWPKTPLVACYISRERALRAIEHAIATAESGNFTPITIFDPAYIDSDHELSRPHIAALLRPLLPTPAAQFLLPVLPFPLLHSSAQPICSAYDIANQLPHSDPLSPIILRAMTRAAANLLQKPLLPSKKSTTRGDLVDTLSLIRQNDGISKKLSMSWKRRECYLQPICSKNQYPDLFRRFLAGNILISPYFSAPTILPLRCSRGDIARFIAYSEQK